jgi:nitrogen regulatory protein P-II 1
MKKIEAIIRPEKYEDVKDALNAVGVHGMTAYEVMGCGAQKGWTEVVRGNKVDVNMLPKIKFEIVVSSQEWADKTIDAIIEAAGTQMQGDGKIFVYDLDEVVRIRTGERGVSAI